MYKVWIVKHRADILKLWPLPKTGDQIRIEAEGTTKVLRWNEGKKTFKLVSERMCPVCGSEDRKVSPKHMTIKMFSGMLDFSKIAICRECGSVYEYKV